MGFCASGGATSNGSVDSNPPLAVALWITLTVGYFLKGVAMPWPVASNTTVKDSRRLHIKCDRVVHDDGIGYVEVGWPFFVYVKVLPVDSHRIT